MMCDKYTEKNYVIKVRRDKDTKKHNLVLSLRFMIGSKMTETNNDCLIRIIIRLADKIARKYR